MILHYGQVLLEKIPGVRGLTNVRAPQAEAAAAPHCLGRRGRGLDSRREGHRWALVLFPAVWGDEAEYPDHLHTSGKEFLKKLGKSGSREDQQKAFGLE